MFKLIGYTKSERGMNKNCNEWIFVHFMNVILLQMFMLVSCGQVFSLWLFMLLKKIYCCTLKKYFRNRILFQTANYQLYMQLNSNINFFIVSVCVCVRPILQSIKTIYAYKMEYINFNDLNQHAKLLFNLRTKCEVMLLK